MKNKIEQSGRGSRDIGQPLTMMHIVSKYLLEKNDGVPRCIWELINLDTYLEMQTLTQNKRL